MIDCCLIYLPKPYLKEPDAQAPLGLMYLAAVLEQNNYSVVIKNFASYTDYAAIDELPEARLYGITATSMEVLQADRFAKLIKQKFSGAKIALGGPGAYCHTEVELKNIDSVCMGEGEKVILDMMLHIRKHNHIAPKYVYAPITELDSIPFPARHLLTYQGGNVFAYGKKYAPGETTIITSSRGCPYKCAFCSAPQLTFNNRVRFRSIENVVDEMEYVVDKFGIKQFRFSDDMFTANKKRVIELCEAIGPLNVSWRISCRVKPLDKDMLKAMKDAGCKELSFGVESFDDDVLEGLNKNQNAWDIVKALTLADNFGFSTRILMMIRTPFQTSKTIELNKYYLERVPYSILACTAFVPIPGCDVWYNPDKYNIEILDRNFDHYNFYMFGPEGRLPIKKIFKIKNRCIDEFHKESEDFRGWLEEAGKINRG